MLKNAGQYNKFNTFIRSQVGRPLEESARKVMEERREILAPCNNIGEVVSPLVLLVVIGFETLLGALPGIAQAPFLADTGILDEWRMGDGLDRSQGETPSMLANRVCRATFVLLDPAEDSPLSAPRSAAW